MDKIDIHCHILPGMDDGAESMEQSLEMLKIAQEDGITEIIATPHFHHRRGLAKPEVIRKKVQELNVVAKTEGLNIKIYWGNELFYTHELIETVKAGEALTLADSDYVLLEFSPDTEKRRIQYAVYQFLSEGYYPIIAHIERYLAFQKDADFLENIYQMGAYFQINAGSLLGNGGWNTRRYTKSVLKNGMIRFVATDGHDTQKRCPAYGKAAEWIAKKCGEESLREYLQENPRMILKNQAI